MSEYVGFDVSKEATAFYVKDVTGKILARGKVATDPGALFEALRNHCACPERIVLETGTLSGRLIPACIDQNPCAHFRCPIDMIVHGCSISLFQASDEIATISSYDLKMRLLSQLSRMYCHIFSTGFNSGDLGGKNSSVMLGGITNLAVVCQPA